MEEVCFQNLTGEKHFTVINSHTKKLYWLVSLYGHTTYEMLTTKEHVKIEVCTPSNRLVKREMRLLRTW